MTARRPGNAFLDLADALNPLKNPPPAHGIGSPRILVP